MWTAQITEEHQDTTKYYLAENGALLTFRKVIKLLKNDLSFRQFFIRLLQDSPYEGYFWEVKPVTMSRLDEVFEFILSGSPSFTSLSPNKRAFAQHFRTKAPIVCFPNLRGDAQLIVPTDISKDEHYTHLAVFVREAPIEQVEEFWKIVAEQYEVAINEVPIWLSTHGLGVYWLHVRIDTYPKYYHYQPYLVS